MILKRLGELLGIRRPSRVMIEMELNELKKMNKQVDEQQEGIR